MRVGERLEALNLSVAPGFGVTPSVVWDVDGAVLFDCGVQFDTLSTAFNELGISMSALKQVIITHQDMDHIGGIAKIQQEHGVQVLAHQLEIPYIQGERPNIKMTPEKLAALEEQMNSLPEDQRKLAAAIRRGGNVTVDVSLNGGEILPYCGGIEVIHTPGHTPGHICLYLKTYKTLIAGDALRTTDGELLGPAPEHTYNLSEALASLKKLLAYDIETIICHHGGVFQGDVVGSIDKVAR